MEFAAGRAYYAMFYTAEALLAEQGLRFRKHGGVHAAFGQHFAKTAQLDPKFHRWLLDGFDKRGQGDYGLEAVLTTEEIERMIEQARRPAADRIAGLARLARSIGGMPRRTCRQPASLLAGRSRGRVRSGAN